MDLNEQCFPLNKKLSDLENTLHFLKKLPSILNVLINQDKSNFIAHCLPETQATEITPDLFLSAFEEVHSDYENYISEFEERFYPKDSESRRIEHKYLNSELKRIGFTNNNLKLKASLLNKLWERIRDFVEETGDKIIDFAKNKTVKLVRDFLNYLNSILGSLKEVFPGIEGLKEFKEVIENYLVIAE